MEIQLLFKNESAQKLRRWIEDYPIFMRKSLIDSATELTVISSQKISEGIYNKPETEVLRRSRKTGRVRKVKLWKRTSDLLRAEHSGMQMYLNEHKIVLSNNSPYAYARHQMTYPAKTGVRTLTGRSKKATYTTMTRPDRTAHWREDAWKEGLPKARENFRNAIEAMKGV